MVATGFNADGLKATGPRAASFTVCRFGFAADFAEVAGFGEATRFGDLPGFDGLLETSDSQPASLTSIGRSTNAAIAAMMVQRRGQTPKHEPANFLPDDSNPCFPRVDLRARSTAAQDGTSGDYEP